MICFDDGGDFELANQLLDDINAWLAECTFESLRRCAQWIVDIDQRGSNTLMLRSTLDLISEHDMIVEELDGQED